MNIENLIRSRKCKKFGSPKSAINIGEIDNTMLETVKTDILKIHDLTDEKYITTERVFYATRRIVAKTKYIKTEKQLYTAQDFDYTLVEIVQPIVARVKEIIGNSEPTLVQVATLTPHQELQWHIDTFLYQQFSNKIHIPLFTNDESFYETLDGDKVISTHMHTGAIWNIDNLVLHRSVNHGHTLRSHLIIDFIDADTLEILENSGINYFHHNLNYMSDRMKKGLLDLNGA